MLFLLRNKRKISNKCRVRFINTILLL